MRYFTGALPALVLAAGLSLSAGAAEPVDPDKTTDGAAGGTTDTAKPEAKTGDAPAKVAPCPACSFECPAATTNCWACGRGLPGAEDAREIEPFEPLVVVALPVGSSSGETASATPEAAYDEVESWIAENPDDHDGALERLGALADRVGGTTLEAVVAKRIEDVRARQKQMTRAKTPEERETEAVEALRQVNAKLRRNPNRVRENVLELQKLVRIARGTSYEDHARKLLERERAKLE